MVIGLLLIGSRMAMASSPPFVPDLQPYQIISPNGTRVLLVEPSSRDGEGPGTTTLTNRTTGEVIWKRKLPYTFRQACVNNAGYVGGFGFTTGPRGNNDIGNRRGGVIFVRILDPEGLVIHESITKRTASFYGASPSANALVYDVENNLMILWMGNGSFRYYHLSRGTLSHAVFPAIDQLPHREAYLTNVHAVPHTPILLLTFSHWTEKDDRTIPGYVFALMNPKGDLIWNHHHQWTLPEDWEEIEGSKVLSIGFPAAEPQDDEDEMDPFSANSSDIDPFSADSDPFAPVDEDGTAPPPPSPPEPEPVTEFTLYLDGNEGGERVTFQVLELVLEQGPRQMPEWSVKEIKREPWSLPKGDELPPDLPRLTSPKLDEFRLLAPDGKPLAGLVDVILGPKERIHALQYDKGIIHVFDREGNYLHACTAGKGEQVEKYGNAFTVDHEGNVYYRLEDLIRNEAGNYVDHPKRGHALHFSPEGKRLEDTFTLGKHGFGHAWYAQPNDSVMLIEHIPGRYEFQRFGGHSFVIREFDRRPDGNWLSFSDDIAFAPDGSLAIRNRTIAEDTDAFPVPQSHRPSDAISLYDNKGNPIRTLDFSDGENFQSIAYDGKTIVAAKHYSPSVPYVYIHKASGKPVGLLKMDELAELENPQTIPFIVNKSSEILVVDLQSARAFRYAMPE